MQQGIEKYGIPLGFYSDRHTIFRSPNEKLTLEQELAGETKPLSHFGKRWLTCILSTSRQLHRKPRDGWNVSGKRFRIAW
ncbi:hypothetical protein M3650_04310 [Paenibacillus sp. MER TA 81-3]|nr:hypothetical protein [Paenibacillus sp. MER TA 81-3]